jgi:hypothetical protein
MGFDTIEISCFWRDQHQFERLSSHIEARKFISDRVYSVENKVAKDNLVETLAILAGHDYKYLLCLAGIERIKAGPGLAEHSQRQLLVAFPQCTRLFPRRMGSHLALGLHAASIEISFNPAALPGCGHRVYGQQYIPI